MQKRILGPGGPQVSAVGVGAMSFTDFYGPTTEEASHAVLAAALDHGIDHIDTANVYGMGLSEKVIGSFLAKQGKAKEGMFRIATKASIKRDAEGRRSFDNSAAHLEAELDASLKKLGVDCVDLFYVHRRDPSFTIEEVAETLAGLVKAGKTRGIGFSEIAPSSLRRAAMVHPVTAVQSEYSLSTRSPELGLVQTCEALGTSLVAFSPVGRGLLTDTPPTAESVAGSGFLKANPRFQEPNFSVNLKITDAFRALAAELGTSAAALSIAWLLHVSPAVIAIPGTRSVGHLEELAAGGSLELSDADVARIEATLPVGWAHGDRYNEAQWVGPERYS
ncbi:aldo/keto reductase [Pelagibius marinus]|uniref:aldo/keto reductase n=1 Tax=Pelagibius marinus TaxID=2762760 RepID=UPI00187333D7|nr:aldo/keto reductase [Pelagibius marinus]